MDPSSAYRESAAQNTNPVHLVVLAYEQLVRDLQRALTALREDDIERRSREIDHALVVLAQLQGTLDMQKGGEVARNLEHYYNGLRTGLLQAQITASKEILQKEIVNLLSLREAWLEVEQATCPPELESTTALAANDVSTAHDSKRWNV
jgi:flagellar protein FliS